MSNLFVRLQGWVEPFLLGEGSFLVVVAVLFFLAALVLFPPSEPLAAFCGIALARYEHHFVPFLLLAVLSYHLGSCGWYYLGCRDRGGRRSGSALLRRKMGPVYEVTMSKLSSGMARDGGRLLLVLRNVPLIRSLVSYPAGMVGLRGAAFHVSSVAGIAIWLSIWSLAGFLFGKSIDHYARPVVVGVFVLFCVTAYFYGRSLGKRVLAQTPP